MRRFVTRTSSLRAFYLENLISEIFFIQQLSQHPAHRLNFLDPKPGLRDSQSGDFETLNNNRSLINYPVSNNEVKINQFQNINERTHFYYQNIRGMRTKPKELSHSILTSNYYVLLT